MPTVYQGRGRPRPGEVPATKICNQCKVRKKLTRFPEYVRGKYGTFSYCYACQSKRMGHWRKSNPTKALEQERRRSVRAGRRFAKFRNASRKRGIEVRLTQTQWLNIIENEKCAYCKGPLPDVGTGLDRKNPAKGYLKSNLVPCCGPCNMLKNNKFSYEEFLLIGKVLQKINKSRGKK